MSTSETPRQRAERVLGTLTTDTSDAEVVVAILSAALHPEELAREVYRQGAWCGGCDYDGWRSCSECRQTARDIALGLRDRVLRGAAG